MTGVPVQVSRLTEMSTWADGKRSSASKLFRQKPEFLLLG